MFFRFGRISRPLVLLVAINIFLPSALAFEASDYAPIDFQKESYSQSKLTLSEIDATKFLKNVTINDITQDSNGFIWIATNEGLTRYDGRVSKHYTFTVGEGSLLNSNWIYKIFIDSESRMWIARDGGVSLYIPESDVFVDIIGQSNLPEAENTRFLAIAESKDKKLWFGSNIGITVFTPSKNKFVQLSDTSKSLTLPSNNVSDIKVDVQGTIFVGTFDSGIAVLKPSSQNFNVINTKSELALPTDKIVTMHYDPKNGLWLASDFYGVYSLDIYEQKIKHLVSDQSSNSLCSDSISDIVADHKGDLWFASDKGFCKYNKKIDTFTHYNKESTDSLASNKILSLFQDKGGVMWVGTVAGLNYWNFAFPPFLHLNKDNSSQIHADSILSFGESPSGDVYVGTWGGGILKFSSTENGESIQDLELDKYSKDQNVPSILVDSRNNLWAGTLSNGLVKFNLVSNDVTTFDNAQSYENTAENNVIFKNASTVSALGITKIIELSSGDVALATYGGGLNIAHQGGSFTHVYAHRNGLTSSELIDIVEGDNGDIWIGTLNGGLNRYNYLTDEIDTFQIEKDNPYTLKSNNVFGLLNTKDYIWLATQDAGVARLDKEKLKAGIAEFQHIGLDEGLASNLTYGVLEDDNGFIWISHSKGLSRLNPVTLQSIDFNTSHGLQGTDFNSGAFYKARNGRMFFGGPNGFNTFLPNEVPINTYKPPIRLTKFTQSNEEIPIHELMNSKGELELPYDKTFIDFEFAALDFTKPENNQYKYKVEGQRNDWVDLGTSNHISFSYLDDGLYTLIVKGSNNDGTWSDELAIDIRVLPPIYRTWYAYLLYFILVAMAFLSLVRQQQIKMQRQISHERKLHKLAYFDSLTGLPNRQSFYESMEKFLSLARRGHYKAGVMFIDLDRFKRINDTLGHDFGDKVLMEVADRLRLSVRNSDFVARNYEVKTFKNEIARLGGDEFTLFLSHIVNEEETTAITQRIIESVSKPIIVDGLEVSVTPSIGIAMYPDNGRTVQELMKHADVAMYQAKEDGRRTFKYFSNSLNDRAFERLQLEEHLRAALKNQEFQLHYQPQVDLTTNQVSKAEALIRWIHPELGFVSPVDFIPIAEESGLIIELGDWILQTACMQAKQWFDAGMTDVKVSVNVSSVQFKQSNLIDNVKNALALSELPSHLLELELTESAVMSDVEDNIGRLQMLKDMGVSIAVDDFGTGYSSLSYLKKFPIDTLKIDRSFIIDIDNNENDAAIVKAIMLLADTMQLNVVAEGVETIEQLKILDDYNCQYIQGYFFSRPLPANDFMDFVQEEFKEKQTWKLDIIS